MIKLIETRHIFNVKFRSFDFDVTTDADGYVLNIDIITPGFILTEKFRYDLIDYVENSVINQEYDDYL